MIESTPQITALLAHAVPFLLVLFRLAGVFLMSPLLSSMMVPQRYKALLAMMIAAGIYPMCGPEVIASNVQLDLFGLVPLIVTEALIGFSIGAIASLPLATLEMSGVIMGQTMGFSLARVYNPEYNADSDLLGQLLFYVALGVFVAAGGLEILIGATIDSFHIVPMGGPLAGGMHGSPLDTFVAVLSAAFELALRVSLPVVGVIMLLCIALGVIGKTMPQINIMSVGFMVKAFAGVVILTLSLTAIRDVAGDKTIDAIDAAVGWLKSLNPGVVGR